MTIDVLDPVASLEAVESSAAFPPSKPTTPAFRHKELETSDGRSCHPSRLLEKPAFFVCGLFDSSGVFGLSRLFG
jgi:hypothetical protein